MQSIYDLSENLKCEFISKIEKRNLTIESILLVLICIYELAAILFLFLNIPFEVNSFYQERFLTIHIILLFAFIIILSLCLIFKKRFNLKSKSLYNIALLIELLICVWTDIINVLHYSQITFFVATLFILSSLITMSPKKSIIILLVNELIFVILFWSIKFGAPNFEITIFNTIIITCISFILSYITYSNHLREYVHLNKIAEQNKNLKLMIYKDSLTSLYNRRYFDSTIPTLLELCTFKKKSFSILMLDIDNFKVYNDSFGHQAGDDCLTEVSTIIQNVTQDKSGLAFRYGGEEFTIIFTGIDKETVLKKAEYIRKNVEKISNPHNDNNYSISISAGIFHVVPSKNTSYDHCIKVADTLLYKVKKLGKNDILFEEEIN
jgi:diguanylate cyclase (GGDEF)-like protein